MLQHTRQKKRFYEIVFPSMPNTWEVDEVFLQLGAIEEAKVAALLDHVAAIWPVSHSLCFSYLSSGRKALQSFPPSLLGEWVRQILGIYEAKGLLGARHFMADIDGSFLGPFRGEAGVAFEEVSSTMVHYLRGISGDGLGLSVAPLPSNDTETIFVPQFLDTFPGKEQNVFLFKLLISLQWGHVQSRIYSTLLNEDNASTDIFDPFQDRKLAGDLFSALQFVKAFRLLERELPGLIRNARDLCFQLIEDITPVGELTQQCTSLKKILNSAFDRDGFQDAIVSIFRGTVQNGPLNADELLEKQVLEVLSAFYKQLSGQPGSYSLGGAALLLGEFDFSRARETIRIRRDDQKKKFVALLAAFLSQHDEFLDKESGGGNKPPAIKENLFLLMESQQGDKKTVNKQPIVLDNEGLEIPEELTSLMREIKEDLGILPDAYVQAAAGQAGNGISRQNGDIAATESSLVAHKNQFSYDEWDYRRGGYRKSWCLLIEKSLSPVRSGFVAGTRLKYRPQLNSLRRQFEMLRTTDRFVRRRRDGDEIDLDAVIDALGDSRAGRSPSDRLFVQLLRDERDITAMFLVDMSNSTEGWVGIAVKEALVLLAESLQVVRDQYGIYGFSGMRRSRCELYHIKHLDEPYGVDVQGRIAAIGPKEYTRMGPPIRHLTQKLLKAQSKVRLLVVISDGKPEDYDDYKGEYAIEDTRKALLEARGSGVHSFCITIDKSAHDYLVHMFGRGNSLYVKDVFSLPGKMAQMYRLLTS